MNYKNKANITLLFVFITFIVISILKYIYGDLILINFLFMVSEASLVGGAADWFAITAIFRKPLGISFHTAIIPRNRDKIIQGITSAVENQLLTKEIIEEKISQLDLSKVVLGILEENETTMLNYLENYLNEYFSSGGKDKLVEISEKIKNQQLKSYSLTNLLNSFSKKVYNSGYDEKIIDNIIEQIIILCRNEKFEALVYKVLMDLKEEKCDNFLSKLSFDFLEKTDNVNLRNAATNFKQGIIDELFKMNNRDNGFREIIKKEIFQMFLSIEQHREKIEFTKEKLIDSIDINKIVDKITKSDDKSSLLTKFIVKNIQIYFHKISKNHEFNLRLDNVIKFALIKFTERNFRFIGSLVSETLNEYDDKKLNTFVEDKFGEDLQWIRINGSVVGGLIGGILFIFLKVLYDPFVVPIIRRII